jgi:CheY-like chemotaxis protein
MIRKFMRCVAAALCCLPAVSIAASDDPKETRHRRMLGGEWQTRGLALHEREPVDVVILDLMLPDTDGLEICRLIRARSDSPILMLTARGDPMDSIRSNDNFGRHDISSDLARGVPLTWDGNGEEGDALFCRALCACSNCIGRAGKLLSQVVGWIYDPDHSLRPGMYVDVPHLDCLLVAAPISVEGLDHRILKPKQLDGVVAVNVDEVLGHLAMALPKKS